MLWPLTIACIDESGNRLPGAAIQIVETLNPSLSVDAYDIDGQLIASPVAGPTGMAKVFLLNRYIDYRYVLDPYESEWITDIALAPFGRAGRWRDDVGGAIAAGTTTDFTIPVPNLGIEKVPHNVALTMDLTHPSTEDLAVRLVHPNENPAYPGLPWVAAIFGGTDYPYGDPPAAYAGASGAFDGTVTFDDATGELPGDGFDLSAGPWTSVGATGSFSLTAFGASAPVGGATHLYAEGDWKLRITDSGTAGGTLNNWTLTFPANLSFT